MRRAQCLTIGMAGTSPAMTCLRVGASRRYSWALYLSFQNNYNRALVRVAHVLRRCDNRDDGAPAGLTAMYENLLAHVPTDLWIGGKWRKAADDARFDVIDPATENVITSVASAGVADAKTAVDAAQDAFEGWAGRKPRERAEVLRKAYEVIVGEAERLAKLITLENGKALSDSRGEVAYAAEFFRWYAEEAVRNIGEVSRAPSSGARIFVQHRPAGVAVLVTPWNFPAAMATRKIGPALAAGCPGVLKPASETPLTMLALMPILEEAGVPAGVLNLISSPP